MDNKKSICLVEDDEYLRTALTNYLSSKGYAIVEAPNGKVAKDIISSGEFDLVISDVLMPFFDGVDLLEWLRKSNSTLPFILITGFSNIVETQKAQELGANGFLLKPFKNNELLALIENLVGDKPQSTEDEQHENVKYCKVSIDEFVARPQIEFDIYILLGDSKYLKVAHKGDLLDIARLKSYKSRGLEYFYIRHEDFRKLIGFNLEVARALKGNKQISFEKKLNFMKYTGETILESCMIDGVDEESFSDAKEFFKSTIEVISDSDEMIDLLRVLNSHSDATHGHSVGVALYAVMIARRMGHTSSQTFFKLSMAGLFHDIGKKEIDRDILHKARPLLTADERRVIESHVIRGKEILESIKSVPGDVIQLVYEHHEDALGQGFPRGVTKKHQHPLSPIVQVANRFVELAVRSPHTEGMSAQDAYSKLATGDGRCDPSVLGAIKSILLSHKST